MTTILHLNFLSNLVKQTFSGFRVPALKGYWMSIVSNTSVNPLSGLFNITPNLFDKINKNSVKCLSRTRRGLAIVTWFLREYNRDLSRPLFISAAASEDCLWPLQGISQPFAVWDRTHTHAHVGGQNPCGYQKHKPLWSHSSVVAMLPLLPWLQTNWNICLFSV